MISFRFHVVSITAVFLAIAIGVVVGSTYVDGAVVDGLEQPDRHRRGEPRRRARPRTTGSRASSGRAARTSTPAPTSPSPTGSPTCRCSSSRPRGVDEAAVERTVALARRAGGVVPGHRLARAVAGRSRATRSSSRARGDRRRRSPTTTPRTSGPTAWEAVADELAARRRRASAERRRRDPSRPVGARRPRGGRVPHRRLARRRHHRASPTWPAPDPRVLVVTGARAEDGPVARCPSRSRRASDGGLVTVVGRRLRRGARGARPGRGARSTSLDEPCADAIVVVDDADLERGSGGRRCWRSTPRPTARSASLRLRRRGRRRAARVDAAVTAAPEGAATSLTRSVAGMGAAAAVSRAFGGAADGRDRGRARHDLPRQHLPGLQQRLQRALRAARRRRAVRGARADLRRPLRPRRRAAGPRRWPAACCRSRSVGLGVVSVARHRRSRPQLAPRPHRPGVDDPAIAAEQQELATYLLRFFIPQVLLYALGAVTTAVLHARGPVRARRPSHRSATPIVLVVAMLVFRAMAGPDPGLDLDVERAAGPRPRRHPRGRGLRRRARRRAAALRVPPPPRRRGAPWRDPDVRSLLAPLGLGGAAARRHRHPARRRADRRRRGGRRRRGLPARHGGVPRAVRDRRPADPHRRAARAWRPRPPRRRPTGLRALGAVGGRRHGRRHAAGRRRAHRPVGPGDERARLR